MAVTAQQVFKELSQDDFKGVCLVVGDEPFQAAEIEGRFRTTLVRSRAESEFNCEVWDGESLGSGEKLLNSLETLPGLFSEPNSRRLVIVKQFEKAQALALELLETYLVRISPDTVLLLFASKVDRRRTVFRHIEKVGYWIEINEPYEREWPKWLPHFERKAGKRIEAEAFEVLVATHRSLSLVWAELQKLIVYVGDGPVIRSRDVMAFSGGIQGGDIFSFVDAVVNLKSVLAMEKLHSLTLTGESEIKLLALLVRQFRHLDQVKRLMKAGVVDPQSISSFIGVHRFGVTSLIQQAKQFTDQRIFECLQRLTEADYRMKLGGGGIFENFLARYLLKDNQTPRRYLPPSA